MDIVINLVVAFLPILTAIIVGSILERNHFKSIRERENMFINLPCIPSKNIEDKPIMHSELVYGSTVVSLDYFKRFLAGLRNIVGGRVRSYEGMVDRGRREAILRMKAKCKGANAIINFRMETSTISKTGRGGARKIGCIEVIAYGTAITYSKDE